MAKYEEFEPAVRRPLFNLIPRSLVEENPESIAAGGGWEPHALDTGTYSSPLHIQSLPP
ncbi:MAG: hypothetical protein LBC51_09850 [Treponema sp.]|nr:hypothetical protein [Treponema sp.]